MTSAGLIRLPHFCESEQTVSGRLPLAGMARLRRALFAAPAAPAGDVRYRLRGRRRADGVLLLALELSAILPARCQRCLEAFRLPLEARQEYRLRQNGDSENDRGGGEWLDAASLTLGDFLEDELLLAAPPAPLHALADCPAAKYMAV